MVKIGMMIGDRYEILEKIGTGGMSDVYKAKCHKLNRYVAVKVLKQEFSENANFVSKFRIEAQAAAGLAHPNIVNVYDVGEENGIYYIVMELVEGITLKKYIEKKARLSYKEAVSIAIQVCMGIEAAHNNHIIHRDIKPQNIIISKDGKVKVTDFGIAKAATSNTITSNVMGSVHYTSPEQARGGYSDEKSDIYSLGITMFEMLTGRVPFNGETTVAIAIKHIQEEMPSPKEYVPEIPNSVESIVLKCCQKSPDRRYQNMPELVADLKQSLMNPEEDFVVMSDPDMEGGTRIISDGEREQIRNRSVYDDVYDPEEEPAEYPSEDYQMDYEMGYEDEEEPEDDYYDYDTRMERITTILAVVAGIIICIIIIVLAVRFFGGERTGGEPGDSDGPFITDDEPIGDSGVGDGMESEKKVPMPDLAGESAEDARNILTSLGLFSTTEYQESDTVMVGIVIKTDVAGQSVEVGSTVNLVVSAGAQGIVVPGVTGLTYDEASNKLVSTGFLVNKVEVYSDTIDAGLVVLQSVLAQTKAPQGSVITLTVSLGKEQKKIRVPNLVGLSEADGTISAVEEGLSIGTVTHEYRADTPQDIIFYQSYSHGSYVDEGTSIDIKVSLGPELHTYKCEESIIAPTKEEAPDYVSGTEVNIKLVTDDGQVLLDTRTSNFPHPAKYYGLTAAGGTITMTYIVTLPGTTTIDPDTGGEVSQPGPTEERSFTRRIQFVQE